MLLLGSRIGRRYSLVRLRGEPLLLLFREQARRRIAEGCSGGSKLLGGREERWVCMVIFAAISAGMWRGGFMLS